MASSSTSSCIINEAYPSPVEGSSSLRTVYFSLLVMLSFVWPRVHSTVGEESFPVTVASMLAFMVRLLFKRPRYVVWPEGRVTVGPRGTGELELQESIPYLAL